MKKNIDDQHDSSVEPKEQPATTEGLEQTSERGKRSFFARGWVKIAGLSLVVFLLLLVFGLPLGAKYYLVDWLKKNGAEQASIDRLGWNPFTGKLWLDGVHLVRDGKALMKQASLLVDVDYKKLFSKDIALSTVTYSGLSLELEQKSSGAWEVATVTIPAGENAETDASRPVTSPQKIQSSEDAQRQAAETWAFLADNVQLRDCRVHYKTPVFDFTAKIDSAELNKFSTRDGSSAGTLVLKGSVNGEPISVNLHRIQVAPALQLAGQVEVDAFDLDALDTLLQSALPFFGGLSSLAGEVDFLLDNGEIDVKYDGDIAVARADVGSDSFRTRAHNLHWQGKVRYQMPADAPMIVDTDGVLQGDGYSLQVPGAELDTSEKLVRLSGKTRVTIGNGVLVKNDGTLEIGGIDFRLPVLQTTEESLLWQGHVTYDLAKANLVETDGSMKIDTIDFHMPDLPMDISEEKINWQGTVRYQGTQGEEKNTVAADGTLALASLSFEKGQPQEKISALAKALGWRGAFHFAQPDAGGSRLGADGTLAIDSAEAKLAAAKLSLSQKGVQLVSKTDLLLGEKTSIDGSSSLQAGDFQLFQNGAEKPMLKFQSLDLHDVEGLGESGMRAGQLAVSGLIARMDGGFPLDIAVPSIELNKFTTTDLQRFALASLTLDKPEIVARHNGKHLLGLDGITFDALAADVQGNASVESLAFKKLVFLGAKKGSSERPGVQLEQARLSGIHWSGTDGFSGDDFDFHGLQTTIIRDRKGKINLVERLAAMRQESRDTAAPAVAKPASKDRQQTAADTASPVRIALGKIRISGKSGIGFEDHTLKIPYKTNLKITDLQIAQLDSAKPEQKSPLTLTGTLEKRAPLKIDGSLSPFLKEIGLDLSLSLKNYPLSSLSPYTVQAIGTGLSGGQLQLESSVALEKNYLKNDNHILLKKLQTNMISKELADELSNQLPVPLDTALSILRDSNENIDLTVPLKGNLDDLHIGLADVIATALGKAVVPALTGYAIYALGPYGALAYVGMKLGEDMLKEGNVPVVFVQGGTSLVAEQKKALTSVGEKMKADRDGEDMQLCPIVASWEFMTQEQIDAAPGESIPVAPEKKEALDALGQTRAKNIQQYLVQTYGIAEDRLLLCTTVIKEEKKMLPVVVLQK